MPTYESAALYIDFSRLPPPAVIETIDYEVLLQRYKDDVLAKNPALERALKLEQSPTNIVLEAEAYGEILVRARINAAARAVMLAFSTGADLDNLAAFFGVERGTVPTDNTVDPPIAEHPETDESLRRRAQLAPEAFSTAGSEGAYVFHALSAHMGLRDATAIRLNDRGGVQVTIMKSGSLPIPTTEQIDAVYARLNKRDIKPLTDVVTVVPVRVISAEIVANLTLYPGPDQALVMADVQKGLTKVRDRVSLVGRDLARSSIMSALNQEGVQSVELISPVSDIKIDPTQCALISSAKINIKSDRAE
jgi:phage-related baseplate assembly protein